MKYDPQAHFRVLGLREGIIDTLPLAIGIAAFGAAFGLLAHQSGMDSLQTGVMGAFVFAGASQVVLVERFAADAGAAAALVAALALNLRIVLMTASLHNDFTGRPWWQIALGAHLATDGSFALVHARKAEGHKAGYAYFMGTCIVTLLVWLVFSLLGYFIAEAIPDPRAFGLDFSFTAAFIAILRSLWRSKADFWPWVISGTMTIALAQLAGLEPHWAMIIAAIAGAIFAARKSYV